MKFVSVRDLRGQSAKVWKELPEQQEMVITSNGRPVAVLSSVNESNLDSSLAAWRQAKVTQAVASIQKSSLRNRTDELSIDDIDEEIRLTRKARKR